MARVIYGFTASDVVAADPSGVLSIKKVTLAERGLRPLKPQEEAARVAAMRALRGGN